MGHPWGVGRGCLGERQHGTVVSPQMTCRVPRLCCARENPSHTRQSCRTGEANENLEKPGSRELGDHSLSSYGKAPRRCGASRSGLQLRNDNHRHMRKYPRWGKIKTKQNKKIKQENSWSLQQAGSGSPSTAKGKKTLWSGQVPLKLLWPIDKSFKISKLFAGSLPAFSTKAKEYVKDHENRGWPFGKVGKATICDGHHMVEPAAPLPFKLPAEGLESSRWVLGPWHPCQRPGKCWTPQCLLQPTA